MCQLTIQTNSYISRILSTLILATAIWLSSPSQANADVVKPALVEISAYTASIGKGARVEVDMRVSLEALLTGINAQYNNTQDAPNAEEYDSYRVLSSEDLRAAFRSFESRLIDLSRLVVDEEVIQLSIREISVPEPGYTKVPRISTVLLEGIIPPRANELIWYYPATFGDNAVRVRQVDEYNEKWHWSQWQWIRDDQPSQQFSLQELFVERPISETIISYIIIGFEHILPLGIDHILFIIGLFLLSTRMSPLLWQVTMFTVAHTITLGLSMSGYIDLPARIVEPLIALSIAYIGIENIWRKQLHRSRLFIIFAFGLLHGLGFASVLRDFGMPDDAFLTALISFNIGVEIGQLAVIMMAFALVWFVHRNEHLYRRTVIVPVSAVITFVGLFWTVERVLG